MSPAFLSNRSSRFKIASRLADHLRIAFFAIFRFVRFVPFVARRLQAFARLPDLPQADL